MNSLEFYRNFQKFYGRGIMATPKVRIYLNLIIVKTVFNIATHAIS